MRASAIFLFLSLSLAVLGEEKPDADYENRLKAMRAAAEQRSEADRATTDEAKKEAKKKAEAARAKDEAKRNLADFKQATLDNLASIKEMFAKAEEDWKNKKYMEGSLLYSSVSAATVPGSEEMAETSRGRLVELEELAKERLKAADDADLRREYAKEVDELCFVITELRMAPSKAIALRRLITLKGRPEIAATVEMVEAQALETDGKREKALEAYRKVSANPRYEHTVEALKARKKVAELEPTVKVDDAKAEKESRLLLSQIKNLRANGLVKEAEAKASELKEKYPNTAAAKEL
jgi:hypothetical protein